MVQVTINSQRPSSYRGGGDRTRTCIAFRPAVFKTAALPLCDPSAGGSENIAHAPFPGQTIANRRDAQLHLSHKSCTISSVKENTLCPSRLGKSILLKATSTATPH